MPNPYGVAKQGPFNIALDHDGRSVSTRLIFVNRFFFPDESATSLILSDLAFALRQLQSEMHVITSRSRYTSAGGRLAPREEAGGVTVHRLAALPSAQTSMMGRLANFLLFYALSFVLTLRLARQGDTVVCLTDPPLANIPVMLAAKLKGALFANWLQDIYPETATALGYGSAGNPFFRALIFLRDRCWRSANANIVIGRRMASHLEQHSARMDRVHVIGNWANEACLTPVPPSENRLRAEWGYEISDCVIGYSGNLGRAHDSETMFRTIEALSNADSRLRFLFIGGGAKVAQLRSRITGGNVAFRGYQPIARLGESLSVPDVHWLSLAPKLEGLIVPSKFYGAAAVGRPIIFIGDSDGEIARLLTEGECGRAFAPGETSALMQYLVELENDVALRQTLGNRARELAETALSREKRLQEWLQLLNGIMSGS